MDETNFKETLDYSTSTSNKEIGKLLERFQVDKAQKPVLNTVIEANKK
jgi:hypothetical protein